MRNEPDLSVDDPDQQLTVEQIDAIARLRVEIIDAGDVNAAGGPSCGELSCGVAYIVGGIEFAGAKLLDDGTFPEHCWAYLDDGTIVDASADQFGDAAILVLPAQDPRRDSYLDCFGHDNPGYSDDPNPYYQAPHLADPAALRRFDTSAMSGPAT
jgi:hypothetical protein